MMELSNIPQGIVYLVIALCFYSYGRIDERRKHDKNQIAGKIISRSKNWKRIIIEFPDPDRVKKEIERLREEAQK